MRGARVCAGQRSAPRAGVSVSVWRCAARGAGRRVCPRVCVCVMHVRVPRVRAERTGVHSAVLAGVCGEQVDVRCPCLCAARHALPRAVRERDPHLCARRPSVRRPAVCGTRARAASVRARCPPVCSAPRVKRLRALHHPALCPQDDYIRSWEDGQPPDEGTEGGVGVGWRGSAAPSQPLAAVAVRGCIPWGLLSDPPRLAPQERTAPRTRARR